MLPGWTRNWGQGVTDAAHVHSVHFDAAAVRAQFTVLSSTENGHPLCFLDTAASAQKPGSVIDAMSAFQRSSYANVHRGLYGLAARATEAFEAAREAVRAFVNAPDARCVVFTRGATEGINLVAGTFGATLRAGDEIVLSVMEHHANIVPWQMLAAARGLKLVWLEPDAEGVVAPQALEAAMTPRTRLVALSHMSNVFGTVQPAEAYCAITRAHGAAILLDGCQAVVHQDIDVQALGCDFYVFSGHKLYGPTGIGVCIMAEAWADSLPPWQGGGEMIDRVSRDGVSFNVAPHRFEAGTPAITEAVGLSAAIDFVRTLPRAAVEAHERGLGARLLLGLRRRNSVDVYGPALEARPVVAFNLRGAHPHDVAQILDRRGVCIRAGHHCAQPLMTHLGVTATARASLGVYSSADDVDQFLDALDLAGRMLM